MPAMIRVSVFYPSGDDATFDHDYYRDSHVPLCLSTWGIDKAEIDKGVNGPNVAAVHLFFDSMDALRRGHGFARHRHDHGRRRQLHEHHAGVAGLRDRRVVIVAGDPSPGAFRGFPREAIQFYEGLALDNSKAYWQANKPRYETSVRAPMVALLHELGEFGPFHIFRPYNDVRFAKNKPPYKDGIGAYGESQGGTGFYVGLSAEGLIAGSGCYSMATRSARTVPAGRRRRAPRRRDRRHRRRAAPCRPHDRRDQRPQDGAARVPEGSPAHRAAAPEGTGRDADVAGCRLAAHEEGGRPGAGDMGRGAAT